MGSGSGSFGDTPVRVIAEELQRTLEAMACSRNWFVDGRPDTDRVQKHLGADLSELEELARRVYRRALKHNEDTGDWGWPSDVLDD